MSKSLPIVHDHLDKKYVHDLTTTATATTTSDSRINTTPSRILCQTPTGSCAACCGLYNFRDRSDEAMRSRLERRTRLVKSAWPNVEKLAQVRDTLLDLEKTDVLYSAVKTCPFAGYLDDKYESVGCMIHPLNHPHGEDLRDLAVYPRVVCAGHFCAPHDWLREREMDFAQTVRGLLYGQVVTDAGLVKALLRLLDEKLGRPCRSADFLTADTANDDAVTAALAHLWNTVKGWPWRDPRPERFGGFWVSGDDAVERTMPASLAGYTISMHEANQAMRTVLDGLGSSFRDEQDARNAIVHINTVLDHLVIAMQNRS